MFFLGQLRQMVSQVILLAHKDQTLWRWMVFLYMWPPLHPLILQAIIIGERDKKMKVTTSARVLQQVGFPVLQLALEDQRRGILFLRLGLLKNNIRIPVLQGYHQTILLIVPVILLFPVPHLEVHASTTKIQMEMYLRCIVNHSQRVFQRGVKVVVKPMLTLCLCLLEPWYFHSHLACITMQNFCPHHQ